eukprot:CAMPEP_0185036280 /NCGR_PEP_ID=MMETSP1103-20130426/29034_1 /TAXON_ID=36769 /ORGANISM="Paraphysomonas bandaiensis, Strain Caron Lab Isolate" /LENGTH=268 /DNA_ID=CAMNT_0027573769 /DNA_START=136 /DNA_END=942 /DNA_ORIENTATION=+
MPLQHPDNPRYTEQAVPNTEEPSRGSEASQSTDSSSIELKRERNRILARETRIRKKFLFENLQKQVGALMKENEQLKEIIEAHMQPDVARSVLSECCNPLPDVVASVSNKATSVLAREDFGLISAIRAAQRAFCITDPHLPDNPIVFASQGFLSLTGYSVDQVLNRNCRFLQGALTDQSQVAMLADGIARGVDTSVTIINYKSDGTPFWNQVYVAALRDANNVIVNYVGVQCEVQQEDMIAAMQAKVTEGQGQHTVQGGAPLKRARRK